jgi:hypothetical protein
MPRQTLLVSPAPQSCPLTAQSTLHVFSLPPRGFRREFSGNYLPTGPLAAPPAGPALAGSDNLPLAVSVWVAAAIGPTMGLEPDGARLPTTTSGWLSAPVLVVRMLTSSLSSCISTTAPAVGVGCLAAFAPWMVPMEKLSSNGNATLGSTCCFAAPLVYFPPSVSCCIQSCCLNSAMAAFSICALGVVTTFVTASHEQALIL